LEDRNWIEQLEVLDARLAAELESCWRDQDAVFRKQCEHLGSLTFTRDACTSVSGFIELREQLATTLLVEPLAEWRQKDPLRRANNALERYRSGALEIIETLPEQNRFVVRALFWNRFRILQQNRLFRSAARQLIRPYDIAMYTLCRAAIDYVPTDYLEAERKRAASEIKRLNRLIAGRIADWRDSWIRHKGNLLAGNRPLVARLPFWTIAAASTRALARWHQDPEATIALAESHDRVERRIASIAVAASEQLGAEEGAVFGELQKAILKLHQLLEDDIPAQLDVPKAQIVGASTRMLEIENAVEHILREVHEFRLKLQQSFRRNARPELMLALEQFEARQRKILADIERACEVVAFALQTTKSQPGGDAEIWRGATRNALALLESTRAHATPALPSACAGVVHALGAGFLDNRLFIDVRKMEIWARFAERIVRKKIGFWARSGVHFTKRAANESLDILKWSLESLQTCSGWRTPSNGGKVEVITRPELPPEFRTGPNGKDLPAIYRRLFAPQPVENARFLVGRDREMAALAEARGFWDTGHSAAVVIIGEQGSGKTSLINCALAQWATDVPVVRARFECRLTEAAQLRTYLGSVLECDPAELENVLLTERRVVVLEDVEKTFLRQVGHLSAIRALQCLISATSSSTLWILAMNQVAFRLLDSTVQFGHTFSHQINAGTAEQNELRKAVMLRHNLSGLRLEFLSESSAGMLSKLPKHLQKKLDAEARFFSTLSQQSNGVFRTAFNIWLAHVESVESGTMRMKPIAVPDLAGIIGSLKTSDLFTLLAVLEHGGLAPAEHASIFQKRLATSQSEINELVSREVLEYEVNRVSCRIRPQAMRVVNEALYRHNLI
jgi:AAA ATPase domain